MIAHGFLFLFLLSLSLSLFVSLLFDVRRYRLDDHRREDPREHRRDNRIGRIRCIVVIVVIAVDIGRSIRC